MRSDPERLRFEIAARDGAARTGRLQLVHGTVETPAFIPLATRGSVRSLAPREVAALGYELVLGNTFHLMLSPGPERIAALGGLHRFMGWERPIITDSGGFQVFSLAHGRVADEIKGRRGRQPARGGCSRSASRGCASAPTWTDRSGSWGPRSRWRCRRRSAPTSPSRSTSAPRTTRIATTRPARWSAPTAGWTAASPGTSARGPAARRCSGSSREACTRTCAARRPSASRRRPWTAWRSAGRWAATRRRCEACSG